MIVSVDVPSTNASPMANSITEIQEIAINYTPDLETYSIKVWGFDSAFGFTVYYRNPTTRFVKKKINIFFYIYLNK